MNRQLTADEFLLLASKGRTLYQAMQQPVARILGDEGASLLGPLGPMPNYRIGLDPPKNLGHKNDTDDLSSALREHGSPVRGYVLTKVSNEDRDGSTPAAESHWRSLICQNYVHSDGKAILCMANFARTDKLWGKPDRVFWSDLRAASCARVMDKYPGGSMAALEHIWRINVINMDTLAVMDYIEGRLGAKGQASFDVAAGSDDFFALLATAHGSGPARMLAAYPNMFGCKTIERATVYMPEDEKECRLCWTLQGAGGDAPEQATSGPSTMSRRQARRAKKLARSVGGPSRG